VYRLLASIALLCGLCTGHAQAQVVDKVRTQFARAVYDQSGAEINRDRPQAMLRAVVVLRVRLGAAGHWLAEVVRENDEQLELTQKALASVNRLVAEIEVSDADRRDLQKNGFMEAWLFQNDGSFALKSLALPQRGL
jgi:hypothetical protein